MIDGQATLEDYPMEQESDTRTWEFHLKLPSARKRERIEAAFDASASVRAEAARRMPSVPRERWAAPTASTWSRWRGAWDADIGAASRYVAIQTARQAYRGYQKDGYDGQRPDPAKFAESEYCGFGAKQPRYRVHDGSYYVSLPLGAGRGERELLPLRDSAYLRERADEIIGQPGIKATAELRRGGGSYTLHQTVKRDVDVLTNTKTTIGVDVGLTNLAVAGVITGGERKAFGGDPDDEWLGNGRGFWSGGKAAEIRDEHFARKKRAQSEGEVARIGDEERRSMDAINHTVSRELVDAAVANHDRPRIVLEDLTGIREAFKRRERELSPSARRTLHAWPFARLRDMIEYKALAEGVPVTVLEPEDVRHTSQTCAKCGHCSDANRPGGAVTFECVDCGYEINADLNAAWNIAARAS